MGKKFANVCCGAGAGRGGGGRGALWRAGCSCTVGTKLAHQYTVLVLSSAQWKIVNRCKQFNKQFNQSCACVSCIGSTWQASKPYMICPVLVHNASVQNSPSYPSMPHI